MSGSAARSRPFGSADASTPAPKPRSGVASPARAWTSRDNRAFYEHMPTGLLGRIADLKGLASHLDLEGALAELRAALPEGEGTVLEIGAGDGRVVRWVRRRFPRARVVALEACRRLARELRASFETDRVVRVEEANVVEAGWAAAPFADAALWMWSGYTELHPRERGAAFAGLAQALRPGGLLVIDVPIAIRGYGTVVEGADGFNEVREAYGVLRTHSPGAGEIEALAAPVGLSVRARVLYVTSRGIPRASYRLRRA
jgi:SAM-dependent methyltransferase